MESQKLANLFKSLSDKNRVEILQLLKQEEKCACQLLDNLDISQSTLSHHMKILLTSDIVSERKDKQWTFYKINQKYIGDALKFLEFLNG